MAALWRTLRYLDADHVMASGHTLRGFEIRTRDDRSLGRLRAVLVEPLARTARFYVLNGSDLLSARPRLVPADRLATVELGTSRIYMEVGPADVIDSFDPSAIPRFSDEDLIDTIFAPAA